MAPPAAQGAIQVIGRDGIFGTEVANEWQTGKQANNEHKQATTNSHARHLHECGRRCNTRRLLPPPEQDLTSGSAQHVMHGITACAIFGIHRRGQIKSDMQEGRRMSSFLGRAHVECRRLSLPPVGSDH
jgi:hypothetical protein